MALWFETALLGSTWADGVRLTFADGRIASIEAGAEPQPDDERHAIALPGLPNLHSHAFQRGMAGLAEARGPGADSFWTWRQLMYRFVERLTPDDLETIAAQAYAEMLEAGFTRVGEFHYLHHDADGAPFADPAEMASRIASAAAETGIALTLLPVFYAHGGFGGAPAGEAQRRFLHDPDSYARLIEACRPLTDVVGIAPHSLRAATPEELRAILPLADGPVHIHIAEQVKEVEDCLAWSGRRPIEWLLGEMPMGPDWCLVHATHMTGAERGALAASGAVAGLCPITEANLGDGIFPAAEFLSKGGAIGVGSDSNVRIDAGEELRLLEYGQRLTARARNMLASTEEPATGARLFRAALAGGAQALGGEAGIALGKPADLVSLDISDPAFAARSGDALIDSWIFAARRPIDCVWRGGCQAGRGRPPPARRGHRRALSRHARAAAGMSIEARIRGEIEGRIRSGEWAPGTRIPFEHELVATHGCARATVNKALTRLAREGLIERRRRAGSFVARAAHPLRSDRRSRHRPARGAARRGLSLAARPAQRRARSARLRLRRCARPLAAHRGAAPRLRPPLLLGRALDRSRRGPRGRNRGLHRGAARHLAARPCPLDRRAPPHQRSRRAARSRAPPGAPGGQRLLASRALDVAAGRAGDLRAPAIPRRSLRSGRGFRAAALTALLLEIWAGPPTIR